MRLLLYLLFTIATATAIKAQTMMFETESERTQLPGTDYHTEGATILFDWNARVRMGLLMGDPVISLEFQWDLIGGVVTLPRVNESRGERYETRNLDDLPSAAREHVGIYNVKLRMRFRDPSGSRYDVIEDVGVPAKPGEGWSFNTPGSPSWDKLFLRPSTDDDYYAADYARTIWRDGLVLEYAEIETATLALSDLFSWYYDNNPRTEIDALDEAISKLQEGIALTFGFKSDFLNFEEQPTLESRRSWERAETLIADRMRVLDRLMSVDRSWQLGNNPEPYEEARRQAQLILNARTERNRSYETPGPSLLQLRSDGYLPNFDVAKPTYTIEGSNPNMYVVLENGNRHGPYDFASMLLATSYVSGSCTSGDQKQHDLLSGEVIRTFSGCANAILDEDGAPKGFTVTRETGSYDIQCSVGLNLLRCGPGAGMTFEVITYDAQGIQTDYGTGRMRRPY